MATAEPAATMTVYAMPPRRDGGFLYETFRAPREEARAYVRSYRQRYPKGGYMTEIASHRETEDGQIEFTMRRLASAD